MDVLSSRILVRPGDLDRSLRFYCDVLGLAVYREFGPPDHPGTVFFPGRGLLEVSGTASSAPGRSVMIWIQARDVRQEHARLAAVGVPVTREPVTEPWGLTEMWIEDPDGIRIVLVEVPADHPLRRDPRSLDCALGTIWLDGNTRPAVSVCTNSGTPATAGRSGTTPSITTATSGPATAGSSPRASGRSGTTTPPPLEGSAPRAAGGAR